MKGKRNKRDVQQFSLNLADNIYHLHTELKNKTYTHGAYHSFNISDPKPRNIHKATVRDRLLHHAIHRKLYLEYERFFIADSYSCRVDKGVHKALNRFREFGNIVSTNNTKTCWILKCDIKKCFASIDHIILVKILEEKITDKDIYTLLENIIISFHTGSHRGLPLGNLTSQLLVNIYLNELDQFVKHNLKMKYYMRYTDDFVFFSRGKEKLQNVKRDIENFLAVDLTLQLHPEKVVLKTLSSGVDFLGWVHFPDHRVLRTVTKKRMLRSLKNGKSKESLTSYKGLLQYGNTTRLKEIIDGVI